MVTMISAPWYCSASAFRHIAAYLSISSRLAGSQLPLRIVSVMRMM